MTNYDSDIVEVRIFDRNFTIYFKGRARLKDLKDMKRLREELETKGVKLLNKKDDDWF